MDPARRPGVEELEALMGEKVGGYSSISWFDVCMYSMWHFMYSMCIVLYLNLRLRSNSVRLGNSNTFADYYY